MGPKRPRSEHGGRRHQAAPPRSQAAASSPPPTRSPAVLDRAPPPEPLPTEEHRRRQGPPRAIPPSARVEAGPPPPAPRELCPAAHAGGGGGGGGEEGLGGRELGFAPSLAGSDRSETFRLQTATTVAVAPSQCAALPRSYPAQSDAQAQYKFAASRWLPPRVSIDTSREKKRILAHGTRQKQQLPDAAAAFASTRGGGWAAGRVRRRRAALLGAQRRPPVRRHRRRRREQAAGVQPYVRVRPLHDGAVPAVRQVLRHPLQRLPRRAALRPPRRLLHAPRLLRPGKE